MSTLHCIALLGICVAQGLSIGPFSNFRSIRFYVLVAIPSAAFLLGLSA